MLSIDSSTASELALSKALHGEYVEAQKAHSACKSSQNKMDSSLLLFLIVIELLKLTTSLTWVYSYKPREAEEP